MRHIASSWWARPWLHIDAHWRAYSVWWGVVVVVALAWPMTWSRPRDSFPLSAYRMFTSPRATVTNYAFVARDADGGRSPIPPELVADGSEVMQAVATIRRAARRGSSSRRALCEHVAENVALDARFHLAVDIALEQRELDPVDYARRPDHDVLSKVLVTCPIRRR